MINTEMLEEVKNRLIKAYDPIAIYLFGSYAWGSPSEDSDLDLMIIVEKSDERPIKRSLKGYRVLWGLGIAKDIIVYTKNEFENASQKETSLSHKVKCKGRVIYAKS